MTTPHEPGAASAASPATSPATGPVTGPPAAEGAALPRQRRPPGEGPGSGTDATASPATARPAGTAGPAGPAGTGAGNTRRRDQYIDGLRALALVRVTAYHTFGWAWLPVVFPSMGVMFALGGALVAASLSATSSQARVLRRRVRRLLPPLWLYGAVLVTAMAAHGWTVTRQAGTALTWRTAVFWLVPLADPPGSAWGYDFVLPLWYIRTYLWLLLLSPVLLWLFRRYALPLLAVPAVLLLAMGQGFVETGTATGDTLRHLAMFAPCWLLGFAHHDGAVARLPRRRTVLGGLLLMAAGLAFALTHSQPDTGWDIDDIDAADALYSAGAVLILLRLYPRHDVLGRAPLLSKLVTAMNSRAMTIYLWGNVCIVGASAVIDATPWTARLAGPGLRGLGLQYAVAWLLLVGVVLAVGWAEDVAAGRRPRLNPWPRSTSGPTARSTVHGRRTRPAPSRVPVALGAMGATTVVALVTGILVVPAADRAGGAAAAADTARDRALPVAGPVTPGPDAPSPTRYPLHADVRATVFWIGAVAQTDAGEDGQSLSSAWDPRWAGHYGGCDGLGAPGTACRSDVARRVAPDWFPTVTVPRENPFYVGLPYNDLVSPKSTDRHRIPWWTDPGFAAHLNDHSVSFVKNRWVSVAGPAGTCYAQVEDSGPGPLDQAYVLDAARPTSDYGINLSPAVYRCVGLDVTAGSGTVRWRFVDAPEPGPWGRIITTRQVS